DSTHPGPERRSEFHGTTVPVVREDRTIAWFHEADGQTASFVQPSVERTELPAKIEFTFINHARESTECGHWNLYKLYDGEWFHLGPYLHTADCRVLLPGGTKTWTMHGFHSAGFESREATAFGHLGGGRYAAVAGYGHGTDTSAALVDLVADPIEITPTDDITAEHSNGTVTVTSPLWEDDEHPPSATLTVTRTDAATQRLIAEQVMTTRDVGSSHARFRGLRNTISFLDDGVETVVLRTDERVAENSVGYDSVVREYRIPSLNQAYRVEIDRGAG
ncbi:MAG: hypothetical protein R3324_12730, partial [Halobacteriales archaeon]|nr:hypothetical protein [Halobacteriales archaeon]